MNIFWSYWKGKILICIIHVPLYYTCTCMYTTVHLLQITFWLFLFIAEIGTLLEELSEEWVDNTLIITHYYCTFRILHNLSGVALKFYEREFTFFKKVTDISGIIRLPTFLEVYYYICGYVHVDLSLNLRGRKNVWKLCKRLYLNQVTYSISYAYVLCFRHVHALQAFSKVNIFSCTCGYLLRKPVCIHVQLYCSPSLPSYMYLS